MSSPSSPRNPRRGGPPRRPSGPPKGQPGWGRVARKGADSARRYEDRGNPQPERQSGRPEPQDEWRRVDGEGRGSGGGSGRKSSSGSRKVKIDPSSLGAVPADQRERTAKRLGEAASAFSDERFEDARKLLVPMAERYPGVPDIQELLGLTLYRLGRWKEAIRALDGLYALTGSTEQHPVLADAYRALGDHERVEELWDELRHDHPDAAVITEGRIVRAGSLADQGEVEAAIRLLEQGPVRTKVPKDHHLRLWYALADLYERAGDSQRASRGFKRVAEVDPSFADVRSRLG